MEQKPQRRCLSYATPLCDLLLCSLLQSIIYWEKFKYQNSKDEHIFKNTRLINCANFRNVITIDFLNALMGLSAANRGFGYGQVSSLCAQDLELQEIKEAHDSNVRPLDEYRKCLGLKRTSCSSRLGVL